MRTKSWNVALFLTEDDGHTTARAVLHPGTAQEITAYGRAYRNPHDMEVPEIGDEVATARALHGLARTLLGAAEEDITALTAVPAHVGF
jgi:hypothetical protein